MEKLLAIALASAVAAASAPAAAMVEPGQDSAVVHFNDLDLGTAHGAKELDRRISVAAQRICRADDKLTTATASDASECVQTAKSRARAAVQTAAIRFGPQVIRLAQRSAAASTALR